MAFLRPGDGLVVWKLDRLGRTLRQLVNLVHDFEFWGIGFKSLSESIDTTTSSGKLVFGIFSALAEFERSLIRERTMVRLESARSRGEKGEENQIFLRRKKSKFWPFIQTSRFP